jgi:hypothetical protein
MHVNPSQTNSLRYDQRLKVNSAGNPKANRREQAAAAELLLQDVLGRRALLLFPTSRLLQPNPMSLLS